MAKRFLRRTLLENAQLIFYWILKLTIVAGIGVEIYYENWPSAFAIFGIFLLTFVPTVLKAAYRLYMPIEFDLVVVFFIFASLFLGEVGNFYARFWWWDNFLHFWSAMLLGILGFIIVFVLHQEEKINLLKPFFIALFAFAFAIMIGACWEIFEYFMDQTFGLNMQKTGLDDTMEDLMVDVVGAFFIANLGYLWLKRKIHFFVFDISLRKFVKKNARVFFPKEFKRN